MATPGPKTPASVSAPTPTPAARPGTAGSSHTGAGQGPDSLSPLEREVLDEYAELRTNLNELAPLLASLATTPTAQVLDTLRVLERKASLVSTLLKASVYSIVLQQQMLEGEGEEGLEEGGRGSPGDESG